MVIFVDDDAEYLAWLERHPEGFVVNTERKPSPTYLMLHRTTCGTIRGTPARGERWTADYSKVCADSRGELETWARHELNAATTALPTVFTVIPPGSGVVRLYRRSLVLSRSADAHRRGGAYPARRDGR